MPDPMKPKVIAVVGPTCVGKSALAIGLAARLQGEVISCDSMQVYRGMDIGTAKVTQDVYKRQEQPATVTAAGADRAHIVFDKPQRAIAKGQSVVLYDGDYVIGGGIIL